MYGMRKKNNEAVTKQAETKNVETTVSSQNEVQETAPAGNSFEEYSSYPYMSEEYTFYYINSGKLEFPDFIQSNSETTGRLVQGE